MEAHSERLKKLLSAELLPEPKPPEEVKELSRTFEELLESDPIARDLFENHIPSIEPPGSALGDLASDIRSYLEELREYCSEVLSIRKRILRKLSELSGLPILSYQERSRAPRGLYRASAEVLLSFICCLLREGREAALSTYEIPVIGEGELLWGKKWEKRVVAWSNDKEELRKLSHILMEMAEDEELRDEISRILMKFSELSEIREDILRRLAVLRSYPILPGLCLYLRGILEPSRRSRFG